MCIDAEDKKRELLEKNTMQGGMFKMDNDPRVTKLVALFVKPVWMNCHNFGMSL